MQPDVVVDIGNSRMKWARCNRWAIQEHVSLPSEDEAAWRQQWQAWRLRRTNGWAVSSVQPQHRELFVAWLEQGGQQIMIIEDPAQLPLQVLLERPDHVGIDRLLNAVAANRRRNPEEPAAIVDAGSAVTVDWVDRDGNFRGGAIFPGLRLMAEALHHYTALLPLVSIKRSCPPLPGTSTTEAMEAGVFWAVVGGISANVQQTAQQQNASPSVFLTGGDSALLEAGLDVAFHHWPEMTLEGIRVSANRDSADV